MRYCILGLILSGLLLCPLAISVAQQQEGLVLYFNFDEGVGDVVKDQSVNGNNGKLIDGAKWSKDGKYKGAIELDGSTSSVQVESSNSLKISEAITLEAWCFWDVGAAIPNEMVIFGIWDPGGYTLSSGPPAGGKRFHSTLGGLAGGWFGNQSDVALNEWAHVASVYDGKSLKLYLNGKKDAERATSGKITVVSQHFLVGAFDRGCNFKGKIDEVKVWNRALNDDEIKGSMEVETIVEPKDKLTITWGKIKNC